LADGRKGTNRGRGKKKIDIKHYLSSTLAGESSALGEQRRGERGGEGEEWRKRSSGFYSHFSFSIAFNCC